METLHLYNYQLMQFDAMLRYTLQRRELDQYDPSRIRFKNLEPQYAIDPHKFSKFVTIRSVNKNEDDLHSGLRAIQRIMNLFRDGRNSFIFIIASRKDEVTISLGTLPAPGNQDKSELRIQGNIFEKTLRQTNYGIDFESRQFSNSYFKGIIEDSNLIAAITGVPGIVSSDDKKLDIRIDDLIKATQGEEYTLIGIMEPIPVFITDELISRCDEIRSAAANLAKVSITKGEQITLSKSFSNSYSSNESYSYGVASGQSKGYSFNAGPIAGLVGGAIGFAVGGPIGAAIGGAIGGGLFGAVSTNKSSFSSENENWTRQIGKTITETTGESRTDIQNITKEIFNKAAERTDKIAQSLIERFENAKERGFWDTGIYLLGKNEEVVRNVANVLKSNISGHGSRVEPIRVNYLNKSQMDRSSYDAFRLSLSFLRNPKADHAGHPLGRVYEGLSTPLTGEEVPIVFNLPRYDIPGIKVVRNARYISETLTADSAKDIPIGKIFDGAKLLEQKVYISPDNLKHHAFVCGVTGSGKTVTCLNLLYGLIEKNPEVKFLVIEPAKNHYRSLASKDKNIRIFTLGNEKPGEKLLSFRFNPFYPVRYKYSGKWKIANLQAHIDYIKSALIAALPMEVAMPAILSEAITKSYKDYGWDLGTSTNRYCKEIEHVEDISDYVPTFIDVRDNIDLIVDEKGFDVRLTMDYKGALKARIDGLCDGGKGIMLNTREHTEISDVLSQNTIMELDSIPDPQEKSIIMGIVMGAIYEYRKMQSIYGGDTSGIQHVTLIEEAHHLLTNYKSSENQEIASSRSKFVEIFANILSEIRAFGEGFIMVEQIPTKLLGDVIKNTSTKIVHKMIDGEERKLLGSALVLTKEQEDDLPFLKQGECIYIDERLHGAQRVRIDYDREERFDRKMYLNEIANISSHAISIKRRKILEKYCREAKLSVNDIVKDILHENQNIWKDEIKPFTISAAILFSLVIRNDHLTGLHDYISKVFPTLSLPVHVFTITDQKDIGKALAWAFVFSDAIRQFLLSKRKEMLNDVINFCSRFEAVIIDELFVALRDDSDYKSSLRSELKSNKVFNEPLFDYFGCKQCTFKCRYGLLTSDLIDTVQMNKKMHNGMPDNYREYITARIRDAYSPESHIEEMRYCAISIFSQHNSSVFRKLSSK